MARTIIIGIDGGDNRILQSLDLPAIKALASEEGSRVLSRGTHSLSHAGWITLFTGVWGEEHGGFYRYPLENEYSFSAVIGTNSFTSNPKLLPLWMLANEMGYDIGLMNIPTTYPAPAIRGFFIAGAGGGQNPILENLTTPRKLKNRLEKLKYVPDIRLSKLQIEDLTFTHYVNLLTNMAKNRKEIFLALMEEYRPELGCVVFVGADRIQHVLMANLQRIIQKKHNTCCVDSAIIEYYKTLDQCVDEICNRYSDSNIVIVSDHGFAPYKRKIDINSLLEYHGFLVRPSVEERKKRTAQKKVAKKLVPQFIRPLMRMALGTLKPLKNRISTGIQAFDWANTKAFSFRHCYGIFLNTPDRFPQGIISKNDYNHVLEDVMQIIESLPGFHAYPCREKFMNAPFSLRLPDIQIDFPEDTFFEDIENYRSPVDRYFMCPNQSYKIVGEKVTDRTPAIFNGIHRSESICYFTGPQTKQAMDVFVQNELPEFYFFIKRLLEI